MKFKKLIAILTLSPGLAFGADANNSAWQFDVAPYLWAVNMDGTVKTGPLTTHVSQSFSEILSELDMGGMLWAGAHKGPIGIFFNGLFADLTQKGEERSIDATLKTKFGIVAVGLSYIALQKDFSNATVGDVSRLQLEPYVGARYTFNNVRLTLDSFSIQNNHHWTDPIVGLRVRYDITPQWTTEVAGDIGGTNTTDDYSYNAAVLLGYTPKPFKCSTFYLGYHYLYQRYETGSGLNLFDWDMKIFGPVIGVNFKF